MSIVLNWKSQTIRVLLVVGLCSTGSWWAVSGNANEERRNFDIQGLTLGMTPEEVARVMGSIDAVLFDEIRYGFPGTDIEFLAEQRWVVRDRGRPRDVFSFEYARPPSNPVVLGLIRDFRISDSLPDKRLRASLHDSYGEPDHVSEARAGSVMVWYDGTDPEQCSGIARGNRSARNCTGPLLRMSLNSRDSGSGPVSRPREARLHDHAALLENREQFRAYQDYIARRVEQQRLENSSASNF